LGWPREVPLCSQGRAEVGEALLVSSGPATSTVSAGDAQHAGSCAVCSKALPVATNPLQRAKCPLGLKKWGCDSLGKPKQIRVQPLLEARPCRRLALIILNKTGGSKEHLSLQGKPLPDLHRLACGLFSKMEISLQ